ncbi:MAG: 4Fe-4S dicluster domain-containing protein [Symbiobacteriaceae bacterium]
MPDAAGSVTEATRQVYWNINTDYLWVMYALMVLMTVAMGYGTWQRVRTWIIGKPEVRWDRPGQRLRRVLVHALGQARLLKNWLPGIAHALLFFGFIVLFLGTVVVFIHEDLGIPIMRGRFYLYFHSLTLDVFGALATIGLGVFLWRRYVMRPGQLEKGKVSDFLLLLGLFVIMVTGFVIEGVRLVVTQDPWRLWSPFGYLTGLALAALFPGEAALRAVHAATWWFHMAVVFAWLGALPYTKAFHLITGPLNVFFSNLDAKGEPKPMDLEDESASLGARTALDLTWKQLLDLDACTECGRCEAACPAFAEGKPLSPKRVILDLRDHVRAHRDELLRAKAAQLAGDQETYDSIVQHLPILAGGVIREETLWACTTCRACEEACPVFIEHVPTILEMRRYLAMERAEMPETLASAMESMETRQHPYRGATADRTDWYRDLPVRTMAEVEDPEEIEYLYWVGCAGAFDERVQKVARALARVMDRAGIKFAVLGPEEQCTGDPARRSGNEYHYEMLARANVETLNSYKVRRIVTHCPHCLQQLKHEYKRFGGHYEVIHHSELVFKLMEEGKLELARELHQALRVTYHDPCYLGRYNDVYDAPRGVLDGLGTQRVEMARSRERSFCCGAGGAHMWYEDKQGGKINRNRAEEAVGTGAEVVVTGCPFCLAMMESGIKGVEGAEERGVKVRDFVELVDEALAQNDGEAAAGAQAGSAD